MNFGPKGIGKMLADASAPLPQRKQLLIHLLTNESKAGDRIVQELLDGQQPVNGNEALQEKTKTLDDMIAALEEGPVRPGTPSLIRDHAESSCRIGPSRFFTDLLATTK